jgi:hypothetical protein
MDSETVEIILDAETIEILMDDRIAQALGLTSCLSPAGCSPPVAIGLIL